MRRRSAALILLLVLTACGVERVDRARWLRMSHEDRVLCVKSLIGAEKVKDAKGGGGHVYPRSADEYVARIDAAYANGDRRDVPQVFAEVASR
jgi:hypothetical protein